MDRKEKKKYIRPDVEILEAEMKLLDTMSLPKGNNTDVGEVTPSDELSRQDGFSDFEESDYDY